jgi:hypothetical protein
MATITERRTTRLPTLADAHAQLVAKLISNKPHPMRSCHVADALDFEDRATHLQRLLEAVEGYVATVMADMKASANIFVDADVTGGISDFKGDVVGTLLNCADGLRGVPHGRAA